MFVFRFMVIFFSLLSFVLHAANMSSSTCSAKTYHALKNEFNLGTTTYPALKFYPAEAFLSNHIYSIDKTKDIGEEFQFGKNMLAKLILYETDNEGFVAGVYVVNNKKIVIAFAGTTGKESFSDEAALWRDVKTNVKLLSDHSTNGQIYSTIIFIQQMQVKLRKMYPSYSMTVTGHSLGGGLAQFASLASKNYDKFKKIKAVTFNTAPMPLTNITKKWIENLDTQKTWSDANNVNFMTNYDPLTLILRYFENREKMGEAVKKKFKLSKGFSIDIVYATLKKLLDITDSDKIKKLIYGKRIVLPTNTGHSMLTLIKKVFPNYASIGAFRHGYDDVKVESYGLYCDILKLMEKHVISYPKKERDYKFYPNEVASNYEVSLFIVNAFYYDSFRKALGKKTLTKFKYFKDKFVNVDGIIWNLDEDKPLKFKTMAGIMKTIYKEHIVANPKYRIMNNKYKEEVLSDTLESIEQSVFGFTRIYSNNKDSIITRHQMVTWISDSLDIGYTKLITDIKGYIAERNGFKGGPMQLNYYVINPKLHNRR